MKSWIVFFCIISMILGVVPGYRLAAQEEDQEPQQQSKLIGQACPPLSLADYMIQGELITQDDFYGKVVFCDIYQAGCPSCESHSMPHLQKLYEKYQDNPNVIILAINTAFEKEQYPWMADEEQTKLRLQQKKWTMPVARDKDEATVKSLRLPHWEVEGKDAYGTPQAFVLNAAGVVVAHSWNYSKKLGKKLDSAFEQALAELDGVSVPTPRKVDESLQGIAQKLENKEYHNAFQEAQELLSQGGSEESVEDLKYLIALIENSLERRIDNSRWIFGLEPRKGIAQGEEVVQSFKGFKGISTFEQTLEEWKQSSEIATYDENKDELAGLEKELGYLESASEELLKKLEALSEKADENLVGWKAKALASRIKGFLDEAGKKDTTTQRLEAYEKALEGSSK